MFTRQAPALHTALWQGGLSPAQASQIQNLLGQCRAPLVHRGPITVDPTTPDMRLVNPESAKIRFPQIPEMQPVEHAKKPEEKEDDPPPPPPPPWPPLPPEPWPPLEIPVPVGVEYKAGDYIKIDKEKQEVSLKHKDFKPGRHCIFQKGFVRGIDFAVRDISDELVGEQRAEKHIILKVDATKEDRTVFEYGLSNLKTFLVVTDVRLYLDGVPGEPGTDPVFRITRQPILAWQNGEEVFHDIPLSRCDEAASGGTGGTTGGTTKSPPPALDPQGEPSIDSHP